MLWQNQAGKDKGETYRLMKQLLTGNEALARGAYEAGCRFASAYPGTPSTEILENITRYQEIVSEWAPNEKVALEAACGASIAGVRSLASMKHVGLNVAADPLFSISYPGGHGGLVIVTADEPGQHSSQNEQDNRNYAKAAKIPLLEPADSQECLDMIKAAFALSEQYRVPALLRLTTRVCHSKSIVETAEPTAPRFIPYRKDAARFVNVPANARRLRALVEERETALLAASEASPFNRAEYHDRGLGVICSGICYYYAKEVFGENASYLKLGFTYPLPEQLIRDFCAQVDRVYIIEENDPYIEEKVKALGCACQGRELLPHFGELLPEVLRQRLLGQSLPQPDYDQKAVVPRPPELCAGCPHRGVFYALSQRDLVITGDIGCYTLGFAPPFNAMDMNLCMGAGISMGHGAQKAFDLQQSGKRVVTMLGDSTFFHSGITSLIEVLYNNSRTVNLILDNRITGMTGHQENPGSGRHADLSDAPAIDIEALVRALGARQVRTIDPNDLAQVNEALDWALALDAPSVIITRWPCALKRLSQADLAEFPQAFQNKYTVDEDKCIGCRRCLKAGCPALSFDKERKKAAIRHSQCLGCGVCSQICPKQAIGPLAD